MIDPNLPDWFFKSYIPSSHEVLGRKLEPLSLNHLLHLNAIDSPLINDPQNVSFSDLLNGVLICTTRLPETDSDRLRAILNPTRFDVQRSLGLIPYPRFSDIPKWKKQAIRLQRKCNKVFTLELIKFNEYLTRGIVTAPFHQYEKSAKANPLPWIQTYISCLTMTYGWTKNVVLNLSYAEATTHMIGIKYLEHGTYNVITSEDESAEKFIKENCTNLDELIKQHPQPHFPIEMVRQMHGH